MLSRDRGQVSPSSALQENEAHGRQVVMEGALLYSKMPFPHLGLIRAPEGSLWSHLCLPEAGRIHSCFSPTPSLEVLLFGAGECHSERVTIDRARNSAWSPLPGILCLAPHWAGPQMTKELGFILMEAAAVLGFSRPPVRKQDRNKIEQLWL